MKKKMLLVLCSLLLIRGCDMFKEDFSDKYVYTTMYPIEYATTELYKDYANISSVYPNGSDIEYEVSNKKKKQYSTGEIFIYSGIANEATLARDLLNLNENIKIIDGTKGMNNKSIASVYLDPSNFLMICSNIKSSLKEYNENVYVKEGIENNYRKLNEKVSELDVKLYDIGKNGNYKTILTTNDVFSFLTKYNINVVSIDANNDNIDKSYAEANKLIENKEVQYIYYLEGDEFTPAQEKFISDNSLMKIEINNVFSLTDEERQEEKDYISIMNETIDNYKKELYKK